MHSPFVPTHRTDDPIGERLRADAALARRDPAPELRGRILAAIDRERRAAPSPPRRLARPGLWLAAASITALLAFAAAFRPRPEPPTARLALASPPIGAGAMQAAMFDAIFSPSATVTSAADTAMRGELLALAIDSSRFADAVLDGFARPMRRLTPGR